MSHCRSDGRCQYAIDHGAEGLGHCPQGKCAMPDNPKFSYRVWPDGTVQCVEDGEPYGWLSDDYRVVMAADEADALALSEIPPQISDERRGS
jgi:hypothetical protein